MSKSYPGNFITGNPVPLSLTSNNGIWDLKDKYHATTAGTWQEADGIYEIGRSLRFRSSALAELTKTHAVAGSRTTFTLSCWLKRGLIDSSQKNFFSAGWFGSGWFDSINIRGDNKIGVGFTNSGGSGQEGGAVTAAVLRDPSAWYHIVVIIDTTNAIAPDRIRVYVNGVRSAIESYTTPARNFQMVFFNQAAYHAIGHEAYSSWSASESFDGLLSEYYVIDGQALEPSNFGYFDPNTNIWQPKRYTGTFGINGFYLPFTENSGLRGLGKNFAGSNYITNTDLSNASWDGTVTKTSNNALAPNGTMTAATVSATSIYQYFNRSDNFGFTIDGTQVTASIYLKRGTAAITTLALGVPAGFDRDMITLVWNGDNAPNILQPTSPGSGLIKGTVTHVGNGWYRASITTSHNAGSNFNLVVWPAGSSAHAGLAGTGTCLVWGPQVNLGVGPDRFIATSGSAAVNDWVPANISVTAGATYDSMVDSPTNAPTIANDTGGVVIGNYATINPLSNFGTCSNANLTVTVTGTSAQPATIFQNTGKWYWEVLWVSGANYRFGVTNEAGVGQSFGETANGWLKINSPPRVYNNGSAPSYGTDGSVGDTFMFALDLDAGRIWYGINGVWQASGNPAANTNPSQTFTANQNMSPAFASGTGTLVYTANFGQRPFAYTPPAGFRSLNTTNIRALGTSTIGNAAVQASKHFDVSLYGGLGVPRDIKNSGFQPDLVWIKSRGANRNHTLVDSVRGPTVNLMSNTAFADGSWSSLTNFNSDGFSLGTDANENGSGEAFVAWQWKAGNTTVTNTAGSITSTVNANPAAGFSVVSYTLNNSTFTVGHGLGVAPRMIIVKNRDTTNNWDVYHAGSGAGVRFQLNSTAGPTSTTQVWNNTAPTSTVFSGNSAWWSNPSTSRMIAYCFAEVPGFSKFGTYVGNSSTGADSPFINLGFAPKWIMIKKVGEDSWGIFDTTRDNRGNLTGFTLLSDNSQAEFDRRPTGYFDVVSNGIRIRDASTLVNHSGFTYIYAAFAESPFALNNRAR